MTITGPITVGPDFPADLRADLPADVPADFPADRLPGSVSGSRAGFVPELPGAFAPGVNPGLRAPGTEPFRCTDRRGAADARRLRELRLVRPVIADVLVAFDAPDSRDMRAAAAALLMPARPGPDPGWVVGFGSAAWVHTGLYREPQADPDADLHADLHDGLRGGSQPLPDARVPARLEVIIPPGRRRPASVHLRGRQMAIERHQVTFVGGLALTDPLRTAADVARDLPAEQALETLRRLSDLYSVRPDQVLRQLSLMRYARGAAQARRLVRGWAEEPISRGGR